MKNKKTLLNIDKISFKKIYLIESQAGTGKTYNIILIYIRLLLGIIKKTSPYKTLTIEEILIICKNKKTAKNLLYKIYKNIRNLRIACTNKNKYFEKKQICKELLPLITNKKLASSKLLHEEQNINKAQICTIYDFCKKILKKYETTSHNFFNKKIIKHENEIQIKACNHFWISNFHQKQNSEINLIYNKFNTPNKLLEYVKPYLNNDNILIFNEKKYNKQYIIKQHNFITKKIKKIKKLWLLNCDKIYALINKSKINKYIYKNMQIWKKIITKWAIAKDKNNNIPKELKYFSQNEIRNISKNLIKHLIFKKINTLFLQISYLHKLFIIKSIIKIKKIINKKKITNRIISQHDLLTYIKTELNKKNKKKLLNYIRKKFPIAIIDDAQNSSDTQNTIFKKIYNNKASCLLMFGDTKKTIYNFTKSNIFNYIKIKNQIKHKYTLNTNFRSSSSLLSAINSLFTLKKNAFIIKKINFNIFKHSKKNKNIKILHNGKEIKPINLYINKKQKSLTNHKKQIAIQFAYLIYDLIQSIKKKTILIYKNNKKIPITYKNISILVRNQNEAIFMQNTLKNFNISSYILDNQQNIFDSKEAKELFLILKAIINNTNIKILIKALNTSIIGISKNTINKTIYNKTLLKEHIKKFNKYKIIWNKYGISNLIKLIVAQHNTEKKISIQNKIDKKNFIINTKHICELLHEQELKLKNLYSTIGWFSKKLKNNNNFNKKYKIKQKIDKNSIQISTIINAYSQEYEITLIPFDDIFYKKKLIDFHNVKNFKNFINTKNITKYEQSSIKELLSANIRLLYIAITRTKYHCSIGISPENIKNNSILKILLENSEIKNKQLLYKNTKKIINKNINIIKINNNKKSVKKIKKNNIQNINSEILYTHTKNNNLYKTEKKITNPFKKILDKKQNLNKSIYNIFNYKKNVPKKFLKYMLNKIFSNKKINAKWISQKLKVNNLSKNFLKKITKWTYNITKIPLIEKNITIEKINKHHKLYETKFYLLINKTIEESKFNEIINKYDALSASCNKFKTENFKGTINGYIKIIMLWKKKFYILKYKLNYLKKEINIYNKKTIKSFLKKNRYDIQYQIYTLAIHRYLKKHLNNYDYRKNFGGYIYLLLDCCNNKNMKYYIYKTTPKYILIKTLNNLFLGKKHDD